MSENENRETIDVINIVKKIIFLLIGIFSKIRKKNNKPVKALIVLDLSVVSKIATNIAKGTIYPNIFNFGGINFSLNKNPKIINRNEYKNPPTTGSSLKKLTILRPYISLSPLL